MSYFPSRRTRLRVLSFLFLCICVAVGKGPAQKRECEALGFDVSAIECAACDHIASAFFGEEHAKEMSKTIEGDCRRCCKEARDDEEDEFGEELGPESGTAHLALFDKAKIQVCS